ncbi:MarR family transcriptional regulator [Acidothermaceae bacterium B102]|nr:MarR family transcriptional regulator [Acidothermaceae bacterium B102]
MTTPWLTEREQQVWLGLLRATATLDNALDEQLRRDAGITHATYGILAALSMTEGRSLHMQHLAFQTRSSQSRLSHAVAKLEGQGYVTRSPCPDNRRAVHATLTDEGMRVVLLAAPGHVSLVRELVFDPLSAAQVRQLGDITSTLSAAMAAAGYAAPDFARTD